MSDRLSARERVAALASSFDEQDVRMRTTDPLAFEGYEAQVQRARSDTGLDEACVWGWADIEDVRCALIVFDFAFLGGSMGMVVGEKVARGFDAARRTHAPVVTVTASGGARMQEGMWSLVQMAKTVEARRQHAALGLAHVALLTSPTTGGVYASFASLADVIYAEEGATVGFAGPRVVEEMTGEVAPSETHTAEFALAHGLIDGIVGRDAQAQTIARALRALTRLRSEVAGATDVPAEAVSGSSEPLSAWERLQVVRGPSWPRATAVLDALLIEAIELRGDRYGPRDDEHVVARAGALRGTELNVVAVGQQADGDARIRPQGFRKAVRAIELAGRLGLPVLTVVDTRGADPLPDSEAGGISAAIAKTFEAMLSCPSPTVALLSGEGGSGGALAMAVADRVLALSDAVFSVIAPEGAAAILYRDPERAPELAEALRIGVADLLDLGLVDATVGWPPGGAVAEEMERLAAEPRGRRMRARARRWRGIAPPSRAGRKGR